MSSAPPLSDAELDRLYELEPKTTRTARSAWFQNGINKCKQNPFVPIACAATVVALYGAIRASNRADRPGMQKWFRYRVYAQGAAIVSMVAGGMYFDGKDVVKDFTQKLPAEIKQGYTNITSEDADKGINFSPSRRGTNRSPSSPLEDQPHHTPHDPIPERTGKAAPPVLVAGKKGSRPSVLSELVEDTDWKSTEDNLKLSKRERRRLQVEEFLAKREEGSAEGRRKDGGAL